VIIDFGNIDVQVIRVIVDKVPGIRVYFSQDVAVESGRAEQVKLFLTSETESQKMIESDEMVHVRMRDKNCINLEDFARGQEMYISEIEEDGLSAKEEFDIRTRIAKRIIYKDGAEHLFLSSDLRVGLRDLSRP
jgi:hypothetical protein